MKLSRLLISAAFGANLILWSVASAQNVEPVACGYENKALTGAYADVTVNGGLCVLDGAAVHGDVNVFGGALETTARGAWISGHLQVISGYDVTLRSADVLGHLMLENSGNLSVDDGSSVSSILVKDSGNVSIGYSASAGRVLVENSGDIAVSGSVASIESTASGKMRLFNARVFPGGVKLSSGGALEICGSEIGVNSETLRDGSGGLNVIESGDVLAVAGVSCPASEIEGPVIVNKGSGNVRFVSAALHSDLIVSDHVGEVEVDGSGCGSMTPPCGTVSDIKIENVAGNIMLRAVSTDSDTTITKNDGNVTIDSSHLGSDAVIGLNKTVMLLNSAFSLEDVRVFNNAGSVLIDRNCDMRLTVVENGNVMITNNNYMDASAVGAPCISGFGFSDADVSKNNGAVVIDNNTGEGLYCTSNYPAPVEGSSGNAITFSDGQCAQF